MEKSTYSRSDWATQSPEVLLSRVVFCSLHLPQKDSPALSSLTFNLSTGFCLCLKGPEHVHWSLMIGSGTTQLDLAQNTWLLWVQRDATVPCVKEFLTSCALPSAMLSRRLIFACTLSWWPRPSQPPFPALLLCSLFKLPLSKQHHYSQHKIPQHFWKLT